MVFIRRRGRFWVAALVVLGGAALWASVGAPGPAAPTAAEEAETVTWCQFGRLRQELHLSSDDLATLACSGTQAETALRGLLAWHDANRENLAARRAALRDACRTLSRAQQKVHVGPRDAALVASLPRLKSAVAAARADLARVLDSAAGWASH